MTQVLLVNTTNRNPVLFESKLVDNVEEYTYLGSKVTTIGECNIEIDTRISKAE